MKIIDFIEPKKVKDIIEEIDSTLSDVGLAKLIEKLIYRYDKVASKKMTEMMGGKMVVESKEDKGTTFSIIIPIKVMDKI